MGQVQLMGAAPAIGASKMVKTGAVVWLLSRYCRQAAKSSGFEVHIPGVPLSACDKSDIAASFKLFTI